MSAAFTHTRTGGNHFNSGERGAWQCAWEPLVSISEVAWNLARELGFTGRFDDSARYVELLVVFHRGFDYFTGRPDHPALNADPEVGDLEGQGLAQCLRRDGSRGLIYPSVRVPAGNSLVCLDPRAVQNARPGASRDLVWAGSPESSATAIA